MTIKLAVQKYRVYILSAIMTLVFSSPMIASAAGLIACEGTECNFCHLIQTLNNVIQKIVIIGIASIAIVVSYAGFLYLTSGGDTGKVAQAHKTISRSIMGFLILVGAYLIVQLLLNVFGVTDTFSVIGTGSFNCS